MARITVVNDNPDFLDLVRDILHDEAYSTTTIDGDRADALDLIRQSGPELLMIDLRMGSDELHGWDIAQEVRSDSELRGVPVLICSADYQALNELRADLAETHGVATLVKPFSIDELTEAIDSLLAGAARH